MKILIASYPRSGSTSLDKAFSALLAQHSDRTSLHEPFSKYWGPDQTDFGHVASVVANTRLLKHHPGNVLSDRQNRELYASWIASGGRIVHLTRRDMLAQAKSLVIARGLNSFHRPHNVQVVPEERLEAAHLDLIDEVRHQSAILNEFDHISLTYEDLLRGSIEERLACFARLLAQLDPVLTAAFASPEVRAAVSQVFAPSRQTRVRNSEAASVRLIDQVPSFVGSFPLLRSHEVGMLRALVDEHSSPSTIHGVDSCAIGEVIPPATLQDLTDRIAAKLAGVNGPRIDGLPIGLCGMRYCYASAPDHDLVLSDPPFATRIQTLQFAISLGGGDVSGGAVHLAGRGPQGPSQTAGTLLYFASGIGARREPLRRGQLYSLVGTFALAPGQILAAGQIFGDAGLFQAPEENRLSPE